MNFTFGLSFIPIPQASLLPWSPSSSPAARSSPGWSCTCRGSAATARSPAPWRTRRRGRRRPGSPKMYLDVKVTNKVKWNEILMLAYGLCMLVSLWIFYIYNCGCTSCRSLPSCRWGGWDRGFQDLVSGIWDGRINIKLGRAYVHAKPINNKIWCLVTVNGESLSVLCGVLDDEVPDVLPGAAGVAPTN